MTKKFYVLIIAFCLLAMVGLKAEVRLPAVFSDNMLLQQKSNVLIWGWADKGTLVRLVASWDNKVNEVHADDQGKWKLNIRTPKAGGPYTILINEGKPVTIKNILIGEVWLCAGQSNMLMPVKGFPGNPVKDSETEIARAKNTKIRFFDVGRASGTEPMEHFRGQWKEVSPEAVSNFSATAWYFGKMLQQQLDVPVGLITASIGGSYIEPWMSKNALQSFRNFKIPNKMDSIKVPSQTPTVLYNGMIHPIIGYNIAGCIWYQGESNRNNPQQYPLLMQAMVKDWRSLWGLGDFPFYYLQIAPFDYQVNGYKGTNSAYLREAQLKAQKLIPNSGMGILLDVGETNCIHPSDKQAAGTRLANLALSRKYGIKGLSETGPIYKGMKIDGNVATVGFDYAENGLTSMGKELTLFEIAGADRKFYPAKASIVSKEVRVTSSAVPNPVAVRYGFRDFVVAELFNKGGLPASSFRSDDWSMDKVVNSYKRVFIFGNSITRHGPKAQVGWFGDWGMAASVKDSDYVHLLIQKLKTVNPLVSVYFKNIADYERGYWNYNLSQLDSLRQLKPDLIIFRLGENVAAESIAEHDFKKYYKGLVDYFKASNPKVKVLNASSFWEKESVTLTIREASEAGGDQFLSLSDLSKDPANMALDKFKDKGVGSHPSDKGMKAIAEMIWTEIVRMYEK